MFYVLEDPGRTGKVGQGEKVWAFEPRASYSDPYLDGARNCGPRSKAANGGGASQDESSGAQPLGSSRSKKEKV